MSGTAPDRTTTYALAVVSGKIVAGELVIAAARRHLADLVAGPARGIDWRADEAESWIDCYPAYFTITDGPNAGAPFELLDWMQFVVGSLFGWYRGDRLRFDEVYLETGKGQGKSPLMACTALLAMGVLGRKRAQIIVTGPKDEQAMVTMADAAAAARGQLPGEEEGVSLVSQGKFLVRGLGDNAHKIEHPGTGSVFKTYSGTATKISGPRPDVVFVDECHELVSLALIDMWQSALAKNARGGILFCATNTPASTQAVGTHYSERAQRVVLGNDINDSLLVFITRVDILDRKTVFDTPAVWIKALPALGITFPAENIEREVDKARLNPSERARVERLYFGIPTGAVDFWLDDATMWDRASAPVDDNDLVGLRCWFALDLSQKHDLTALTGIWERPATELAPHHLFAKTWYWTCRANLATRARVDGMPYDLWEANKQINVVEGDAITKDFVAAFLGELVAKHDPDFLVYDVADMENFIEACDRVGLDVWRYKGPDKPTGSGLKLVAHSQGTRRAFKGDQLDMHGSIEALEDDLRLQTTTIDDSPVTYACAANAAPITDAVGNRAFDKQRSRGRIDGLVTTAMAHGAAAMVVKQKPPPQILLTRPKPAPKQL
ncbi:MAG: terminase TerL endonuclease subunit [Janthinobacterium lividum]